MLEAITQPIRRPKSDRHKRDASATHTRVPGREQVSGRVGAIATRTDGSLVHVTGRLPMLSSAGLPVQYRVVIAAGDDSEPMASDAPQRFVGAGPDADVRLLGPTRVGRLESTGAPDAGTDLDITPGDVDPTNGWIDLCSLARRTLADRALIGPGDRLRWIADGDLITIDTSALLRSVTWLVLRVDAREIGGRAPESVRPLPGSGRIRTVCLGARRHAISPRALLDRTTQRRSRPRLRLVP